jgi:hypothetical protein
LKAVVGDHSLDAPRADREARLAKLLGDDIRSRVRIEKAVAKYLLNR